jgi:hypothetical protein
VGDRRASPDKRNPETGHGSGFLDDAMADSWLGTINVELVYRRI